MFVFVKVLKKSLEVASVKRLVFFRFFFSFFFCFFLFWVFYCLFLSHFLLAFFELWIISSIPNVIYSLYTKKGFFLPAFFCYFLQILKKKNYVNDFGTEEFSFSMLCKCQSISRRLTIESVLRRFCVVLVYLGKLLRN